MWLPDQLMPLLFSPYSSLSHAAFPTPPVCRPQPQPGTHLGCLCQRDSIFAEPDPNPVSFPLCPSPFSAHSPASFLPLGLGGFRHMSSPPCSPCSHTHIHTHTVSAFLPSACVQGPPDPLGAGPQGWGPLSASGDCQSHRSSRSLIPSAAMPSDI